MSNEPPISWATRPRAQRVTLGVVVLLLCGCARDTKKPEAGERTCLEITATMNSAETRAVFTSQHCQGGGVTWAGLLGVLANRRGRVEPILEPTPGWVGAVYRLNDDTRFSLDDEGDRALFCATAPRLVTSLRAEYNRLNTDAAELRRAMGQTSLLNLECLPSNGGVPSMKDVAALTMAPGAAEHLDAEHLKVVLRQQDGWCFPPNEVQRANGALRLIADGTALHISVPDKKLAEETGASERRTSRSSSATGRFTSTCATLGASASIRWTPKEPRFGKS